MLRSRLDNFFNRRVWDGDEEVEHFLEELGQHHDVSDSEHHHQSLEENDSSSDDEMKEINETSKFIFQKGDSNGGDDGR